MAEAYIGEIRAVAFNYAPRDWAMCDGQVLEISQNHILYALLGNTYGGDGRTTFKLPDLRGRTIIHAGRGQGLMPIELGESGGHENITISESQMPLHNHDATFKGTGKIQPQTPQIDVTADVTVHAYEGKGNQDDAKGNYWATGEAGTGKNKLNIVDGYSSTSNVQMALDAVTVKLNSTLVAGTTGGGITDGEVTVKNRGGSQPLDIRTPYLTLHYIICISGLFPPRN